MIHVCFGLYDKTGRYSKFTGTTMLSIFENTTSPVTVHILHDDTLTQDNRDKFIYLVGRCGQRVEFHNAGKIRAENFSETVKSILSAKASYLSIGAIYRLLIPQLLPAEIDRCIYLDSDLVVNLDVSELWQFKLGEKIFAAVPEIVNRNDDKADVKNSFPLCQDNLVKAEDYFNSGVMLMNLTAFREEMNHASGWPKVLEKNHDYGRFADQDFLNYYFSTDTLKLPVKFNRFTRFARTTNETVIEKKIYHYAGGLLGMDMNDQFNRLWMKYFIRTPWFDEEAIGRLYAGVQQVHTSLKNFAAQISAMMSGKTRAFFTLRPNVEATKKIFSVRDDEKIIFADKPDSLQKLIDAMKLSKGKKIFFILVPGFPFQALTQAGFAFGKDFLNGMDFLSEAQGLPLISNPLIHAM